MTDDASLIITQPFDYSLLPDDLAVSLKERAHRIRSLYEKTIIDIGRDLAEAQDDLAHHKTGTFQAWAQAELGLSRGSVYNLINVYKRFGNHPTFGQYKLSLGRSALYLLAQPSTPDEVIDDITQRLDAGEPVTHQDVKTAVRKAKGPTEFQQRVGKRIVATLKQMGPLALADLVKYAGYIEINVKAALRHLDQVTLQETPDGAEVYWFADTPFPKDDPPSPADELRATFDTETIRIGSGPTDEGAWHRCIDIAHRLREAGLWDGQQRLIIHDPYTLHNRLAGVEHLPVTNLVSGEHYDIVVSRPAGPLQDGLADGTAFTTSGDPDYPAPLTTNEPEPAVTPTPPQTSTEGPGEESDPVISDASRQFADDAKLSGDILVALTPGPKSLMELSKATEVHPTRLLDVLPRLVTTRLLTKTTVPGGQARYALPDSPTPAGTPPVGKNGAGIPDSHNPEREAAIAAAARVERAALDVISTIERFTQLKGIRALHALDADRLVGVEQLLNQVVSQAAAANGHAVDLMAKVRTMAATGQPYDDVSTT
jgi:hypothetical protein